MEEWFAFFGPPGMPAELVEQMNRRLRSVIDDQEVVELLKPLGLEVETTSSDELTAMIDSHRRDWLARMEATGVKAAAVK